MQSGLGPSYCCDTCCAHHRTATPHNGTRASFKEQQTWICDTKLLVRMSWHDDLRSQFNRHPIVKTKCPYCASEHKNPIFDRRKAASQPQYESASCSIAVGCELHHTTHMVVSNGPAIPDVSSAMHRERQAVKMKSTGESSLREHSPRSSYHVQQPADQSVLICLG